MCVFSICEIKIIQKNTKKKPQSKPATCRDFKRSISKSSCKLLAEDSWSGLVQLNKGRQWALSVWSCSFCWEVCGNVFIHPSVVWPSFAKESLAKCLNSVWAFWGKLIVWVSPATGRQETMSSVNHHEEDVYHIRAMLSFAELVGSSYWPSRPHNVILQWSPAEYYCADLRPLYLTSSFCAYAQRHLMGFFPQSL